MSEDVDKLIRDTLHEEDAWLKSSLQEDPLMTEAIVHAFRGRKRWLTIFPMFLSLVYTGLLAWCCYRFYLAEITKHQIAWAVGIQLCGLSVGLCKIWIWGEWRRQTLAREIKRLELRIASLQGDS
ncbi:hypothetical protein Mal64_19710 [Pseudobythopirellula maris]|uniref:Uncharacterized protein n=1 Tax=Pseudobythopirellula maris TaxID=2527991 RepID=A0A5C5ZMU8_9BACT|nr:DUF6768 family protein [Pseudobythopirellula maris]TWT88488.1 hypothetical protein Mal64_19710 [Pseudobythopirellula maris]